MLPITGVIIVSLLASNVRGLGSDLFEDSQCGCFDRNVPGGGFSCGEQAEFGKCLTDWMVEGEYCENACDRCFCVGECICKDIPPNGEYSCAEQKEFNKCDDQWMIDGKFCDYTCGRCDCLLTPSAACIQYTLDVLEGTSIMLDIIRNTPIVSQELEKLAASPATYLIPSDKAWEEFKKNLPNADVLFQNQQLLAEFIAFHILTDVKSTESKVSAFDGAFKTMHKSESLLVVNDPKTGDFLVRDKNQREAGIQDKSSDACGSKIHIIDDVLIPTTTSLPFDCLKFTLGSRKETKAMLDLIESYPRLRKLFEELSLQPHTYFIPSTQAWNLFRENQRNGDALFGNEDLLAEFFAYHIVASRGMLADLDKESASLHLGEVVGVSKQNKRVIDNNGHEAKIITADIQACGSVINVIDRVLVPSTTQFPQECLMYTLSSREDTSEMLDIINQTDLFSLVNPIDRTYLVPSNSAWNEFREGLRNAPKLFNNADLLSEFILYHVLEQSTTLSQLQIFPAPSMHLKETVKVENGNRVMDNNDYGATVVSGDIKACSSVIHVIDRVLMPTTTLHPYECLTFALGSRKDTSTFLDIIGGSNILQAVIRITSMLPHTYLVPNGEAFFNLISSMDDASILMDQDQLLAEIVSYHMMAGSMSSNELLVANNVTTKHLSEEVLVQNGDGPEVRVMDKNGRVSTMVDSDFQACNSTLHVMDDILVPSTTKSPLECLHFAFETLPGTQMFAGLIKNSSSVQQLLETLAAGEPHTFLVPSDKAVEEFLDLLAYPDSLSDNDKIFEELIKYHIIRGEQTTDDLYQTGDIATLLFEEPVEFDIMKSINMDNRSPKDTDAVILMPDIHICNARMHIIDHMLYPAITSVQGLLNSDDGMFRSLALIPLEPLITFKDVGKFERNISTVQIEDQEEIEIMEIMELFAPEIERVLDLQQLEPSPVLARV